MNRMIYTKNRQEPTVLYRGVCYGYPFCIVSFGTHPCVYVAVKRLIYFGTDFFDIPQAHGGITYAGYCPDLNYEWSIGWDYGHAGDYHGRESLRQKWNKHGHKWTVDEILKDVDIVCTRLDDVTRDIIDKYGKYQKPFGIVPMSEEIADRLLKAFESTIMTIKK